MQTTLTNYILFGSFESDGKLNNAYKAENDRMMRITATALVKELAPQTCSYGIEILLLQILNPPISSSILILTAWL